MESKNLALDEWFRELRPRLVRYAERICPGNGEDICHDAYVACLERQGATDCVKLPSEPFIFGIARNLSVNDFRRRRRNVQLTEGLSDLPTPGRSADLQCDTEQVGVVLASAIEKLPVRYRTLVKGYLEGLRPRDIARRGRICPATVRTQLHRARRMLKRIMRQLRHT